MAANPTPQEVEETGSSWPLPPMQYINNYSDEQVSYLQGYRIAQR